MVTFVKKIKTKEGINSIDLDKIKKGIPATYKVADATPVITYTANHVVVAYQCQAQKQRAHADKKAKPVARIETLPAKKSKAVAKKEVTG